MKETPPPREQGPDDPRDALPVPAALDTCVRPGTAPDFHRLDLRNDRALDEGHLRLAVTLGWDVQGGVVDDDNVPPARISDLCARLRLELDRRLSFARTGPSRNTQIRDQN